MTKSLRDIKTTLSEHFGGRVVTLSKLKATGRSQTIKLAKSAGLIIAREEGHSYDEIAREFGYRSKKSAQNAYSIAKKKLSDPIDPLDALVSQIRKKLEP